MPLKVLQEQPRRPKTIKHILAIAAGKGGVGKSTVTVELALTLKKMGYAVGILDGDLYGPSIRKMLPEQQRPLKGSEKILPAECLGIRLMTLDYFNDESSLAAWRAPIANRFATQFFTEVDWGVLDFLLIDFPPGIGDLPMTLSQKGEISGAIIVTTPQDIAIQDVVKACRLFNRLNVPILGIVENMSHYDLPDGQRVYPFGKDGGKQLAASFGVPLFGIIPLDSAISQKCDIGWSELKPHPIFQEVAERLIQSLVGWT